MSRKLDKKPDPDVKAILQALAPFAEKHPQAKLEAHRRNPYAVHIRIVDPAFTGVSRADRHDDVWEFLAKLDENLLNQISVLLLLTPEEKQTSIASLEFDDPVPATP